MENRWGANQNKKRNTHILKNGEGETSFLKRYCEEV